VILRVFRGAVAAGHRDRVLAHLRDHIYPTATRIAGLRSFQAGLRTAADGPSDFSIITTWDDFERLVEALGGDLDRPRWLAAVEDVYEPRGAQHYELVGEQLTGVFPLEGAVLRVLEGRLTPHASETFFDFARRRQGELLDDGMIVASHIGRRIVGTAEEAIYVVLWRDVDAIQVLGGDSARPAAEGEWSAFFETWNLHSYDALTQLPPRLGAAPALLLADDDRRYLFATKAAAELLGRPIGRILGRRIEDVTSPGLQGDVETMWQSFIERGTLTGQYELADRHGSTRNVGFAARAHTPWPGCHTSLLVPDGVTVGPDDIAGALSEAGIVARYPVVAS
jgi:PAS domain-containing protein